MANEDPARAGDAPAEPEETPLDELLDHAEGERLEAEEDAEPGFEGQEHLGLTPPD